MPTILTFLGEANIEGPRIVRAVPETLASIELKIEKANTREIEK